MGRKTFIRGNESNGEAKFETQSSTAGEFFAPSFLHLICLSFPFGILRTGLLRVYKGITNPALTPKRRITRMPAVNNLAISFSIRSFVMNINPDFLAILRCPFCKSKVELKPDGSGLKCGTCHRVYPIRDEIPIMIIEEAVIEDVVEA